MKAIIEVAKKGFYFCGSGGAEVDVVSGKNLEPDNPVSTLAGWR